ncbi:hypothetical protein LCGC14_0812890 [marine sediment metagenome]|uniref:Uncharacterized protein n=1 Tax=marine sediment metagenome TaxID=412755 RepID=A0A0F9PQN4_9ZZZZ
MKVYFESVPAHYEGDYPSITIHYRPQDKPEAERMKCLIECRTICQENLNSSTKGEEG